MERPVGYRSSSSFAAKSWETLAAILRRALPTFRAAIFSSDGIRVRTPCIPFRTSFLSHSRTFDVEYFAKTMGHEFLYNLEQFWMDFRIPDFGRSCFVQLIRGDFFHEPNQCAHTRYLWKKFIFVLNFCLKWPSNPACL